MLSTDDLSKFSADGYFILRGLFTDQELEEIISEIKKSETESVQSKELFAIRELFNQVPSVISKVFNKNLKELLRSLSSKEKLFLSKAIYFDKPANSNWFVPFHQDLTINVAEKVEVAGFKNWTKKRGQIGVQPPTEYLNRTITIRIHLDNTNSENGALRILPETHTQGVIKKELLKSTSEVTCEVRKGGVMLMKPLVFHASNRSQGHSKRRVIHLEFCDMELPEELSWKEKVEFSIE